VFPIVVYFNFEFKDYKFLLLIYVIVFNILFVRIVGRYLSSAIAYPFSNICASAFLKKNLNAKFGNEFAKRIDHMSTLVSAFSAEGSKMTPESLAPNSMAHANSFVDSESSDTVNALFRLTSGVDLYHLLAGNIELIQLYLTVNEQILEEATTAR
jgi:hypothetical protein